MSGLFTSSRGTQNASGSSTLGLRPSMDPRPSVGVLMPAFNVDGPWPGDMMPELPCGVE